MCPLGVIAEKALPGSRSLWQPLTQRPRYLDGSQEPAEEFLVAWEDLADEVAEDPDTAPDYLLQLAGALEEAAMDLRVAAQRRKAAGG